MIKEECIAAPENVNPCSTQLKTFRDLHNIEQGLQESVAEYAKRVKVSATILYGRINPKLHENYPSPSPVERKVSNEKTDEIFVKYVIITGTDPTRFEAMIDRLEASYSVGNNNYPLTIMMGRFIRTNKRVSENEGTTQNGRCATGGDVVYNCATLICLW
jgi:hypothetical protein